MSLLFQRLAKAASPSWWRRRAEYRRLAALPRRREGTTTLFGAPLRFTDAASLLSAGDEIFVHGIYRFPSSVPAPRIIDAGANIGLASLYLKRLHPAARVTALEPDPGVAAVLRRNLEAWGCGDVEVVEKALGAAAGRMPFAREGSDSGRLGAAPAGFRQAEVETVPLAAFLGEPVDFLKIDIEGAEVDVLEAARPHLGAVRRLFVEYHSFVGQPQRLDRLLALLREAGFRVHVQSTLNPRSPLDGAPTLVLDMDMQLNVYGWRE